MSIYFLFLIGCQPIYLYQEAGNRKLVSGIHDIIKSSGLNPNLGIKIISLKTGKTLYSLHSDHLFNPASNNKIYTAVAALKYLTPQYRFRTTVWIDSADIGKAHVSRLVLKGGGDPDLSLDDLMNLAKTVSGRIQLVDTLVLDNTIFDDVRYGNGWMWDEGSWWYAAQVDALTLNDNCVDITISPSSIDSPPVVTVSPNTEYVTINNLAVTVSDIKNNNNLEIERRWREGSNILDITGNITVSEKENTYYRNIENPALFSGQVFKEFLQSHGVSVPGPIITDTVRENSHTIASHISPPLTHSLMNFLKTSDNLTGELLVKSIGWKITGKQGTWANGLNSIKTFLNNEVGVDTTGMTMADGSGVSRYNLTSPDQLIQILEFAYHNFTLNAEFIAALPTGGWDGTLKRRLRNDGVNRRIRAKTGTLAGVSCLSGYVNTKDDEPLAFSIMMNGYVGSAKPYQQLQDEICTFLANFSK